MHTDLQFAARISRTSANTRPIKPDSSSETATEDGRRRELAAQRCSERAQHHMQVSTIARLPLWCGIGTSADQDCGGCDSFGGGKIVVTMAFFPQDDVPNAQTAPLAATAHLLFVATIPQTHDLMEAPLIQPDFSRGAGGTKQMCGESQTPLGHFCSDKTVQ